MRDLALIFFGHALSRYPSWLKRVDRTKVVQDLRRKWRHRKKAAV